MSTYIMDAPSEGLRLERKTDDEFTRQLLSEIGVKAGMCVLDAGAGTGAVARVLSDMVGPSGSVTALDVSEERISHGRRLAEGIPNLSFRVGDILSSELQGGQFDLVWCRFVLEYLDEPQQAVDALAGLLKPGGKLALADLDGNTLFHYPMPPEVATDLSTLMSALEGDFDPHVGRKLYHFAHTAGLANIRVQILPYHIYAGSPPSDHLDNWRQKLETIAARGVEALGSASRYSSFVENYMTMLAAADTFYYSVLIMVEGERSN